MTDNDKSEHYIKRDESSKATYYIIRCSRGGGLFYTYNQVAGHIRYALSKKYLPVVDMKNYPNSYLAPENLSKENAWEYYFEQPLGIDLEEAYNGKNVILGMEGEFPIRPYESVAFFENRNNIVTEWRMLVKLGLLRIKQDCLNEILNIRSKLFSQNVYRKYSDTKVARMEM